MTELDLDAIEARAGQLRRSYPLRHAVAGDVDALIAEVRRLRAFAQDIADHGLHADLNPTVDTRSASIVYAQMAGFLRRIDGGMRLRARGALIPDAEVSATGDQH